MLYLVEIDYIHLQQFEQKTNSYSKVTGSSLSVVKYCSMLIYLLFMYLIIKLKLLYPI